MRLTPRSYVVVITAAALAVATAPVLPAVAAAPQMRADAATPHLGFFDLGPSGDTGHGSILGLTDDDRVALSDGVFQDGGFTTAPTFPGDTKPMKIAAITNAGVAIGNIAFQDGGYSRPGYWNAAGHGGAMEYPPVCTYAEPNETSFPEYSGLLDAVTPQGQAAFGVASYCYSHDSLDYKIVEATVTGTPQPSGSFVRDANLDGVGDVRALQAGWAIGETNNSDTGASSEHRLNRSTGAVTDLPITPGPSSGSLASDGMVVGNVTDPAGGPGVGEVVAADGTVTPLALPTGSPAGTVAQGEAINSQHEVVGFLSDQTAGRLVVWPTPTSQPISLSDSVAVPSGWTLDQGAYINSNGDVAGVATAPDGTLHFFLMGEPAPADLSASITVTDKTGQPLTGTATGQGKTLVATVTLSAAGTAMHALTDVTADPALTASPDGKLTQLSRTGPPAGGYTLQPGQQVSYQVSYTITGTGSVRLSADVTGQEDNGDGGQFAEKASAQADIRLDQPLAVAVSWQHTDGSPLLLAVPGSQPLPDTLRLTDTDAGEVPQDVVAMVKVTNTSTTRQTAVTINGIPALSYHRASDARQALPIGVTVGPLPGGTLADLAPGDSAQVTYRLTVINNGSFDFSPQVLSSDDTNLNSVSQGVGTVTALPTALLWLSVKQRDSGSIRAGEVDYLSGRVTNRSLTQTVDVAPLEPSDVQGNAGDGALTDVTKAPLADGTVLPFGGKLAPGQSVDLEGEVDTAAIPATRATLTYQPAGLVVNDDATETDLSTAQVGLAIGSSPQMVAINDTEPVLPPITAQEAVDNFTQGAVEGAGEWAVGHLRAAGTLLSHPIDGAAGAAAGLAKVVVHTPRDLASAAYIIGMVDIYSAATVALTPAQRSAFEKNIIDDYDQSYVKADNAEAGKAIEEGLLSFDDAVTTGDYRKVANLAGHGLSAGGGIVGDAVLSDIFFQQLGIGLKGLAKGAVRGRLANALVLADEALQKKLPAAAYREVKSVKAGQNLLLKGSEALENIFGMTQDQITNLRAYCKENKLIVAVRARSKRAADLIRRGLAVGKNEILKLKGVNEIDVEYLGYAKSDLNTLVFAEPVPKGELLAELDRRGITGNDREIVLERYKQRKEEWTDPKVAGVMDKANAKGEIEWGFNGTDNAAKGADRSAQRRFKLHDKNGATMLDGKTPRKYQTVYVSNVEGTVGGRLVRVTQDTDMLAILSENGQILAAKLRTQAYEYLSDALGIEHPETVSWINKGDILFLAKIKELLRTAKGGGEALAVFGADGSARAGFLNPALTVYDAAEKTGVIFFEGGYNNPYAKAITSLAVKLKRFAG